MKEDVDIITQKKRTEQSWKTGRDPKAGLDQGLSAMGDVPSTKQRHPLYPKIRIHVGNPGMYYGCPLTTTACERHGFFQAPPPGCYPLLQKLWSAGVGAAVACPGRHLLRFTNYRLGRGRRQSPNSQRMPRGNFVCPVSVNEHATMSSWIRSSNLIQFLLK